MKRNGVFGLSLALAAALVLLVAPETSTGAGGDAISAQAPVALVAGGTTTLPQTLHLDTSPPAADVLLAFDTTGSMASAITDAETDAEGIVQGVQNSIPNARFALADFKDYPTFPFGTPPTSTATVHQPCTADGCDPFSTSISTHDTLTASFASAGSNCGTLNLDFYLDGGASPVASASVAPNASTGTINLGPTSNAPHTVTVHAAESCDGAPSSWDGTLTLTGTGDYPYKLVQPLDPSGTLLKANLKKLSAWGGYDEPEAYNRLFYEAYHDGANIGYAARTPRFVIVLGDSYPHDANQNAAFPSCPNTNVTDPGTGGDNGSGPLTSTDTLTTLKNANINLSFVTYNPGPIGESGPLRQDCQKQLAEYTGGSEIVHDPNAGTSALTNEIVGLINQAAAHIDSGSFTVLSGTGPGGAPVANPNNWFSFDSFGPTGTPNDIPFNETISVPADTAKGQYTFTIAAIADGAQRATQTVVVNVGDDAVSNVNFTVDEPTLPAGIAVAPFNQIPAARIPFFSGASSSTTTPYGATPYGATPYGATPFGATPYGATPWGATPYGATPYGATPYGATPFGATPWGATPFGATGLGGTPYGATPYGATDIRNPLNQVLLSQISLTNPADGATWAQVLGNSPLAAKPLSASTLGDVASDTTTGTDGKMPWDRFRALPAKDVPFLTSVWQGIPVGAIVLGTEPIKSIPNPSDPSATTDSARAASWAATIAGNGGCAGCTTGDNTFFGIAAAGALGSTDIGSIPYGATPYGATAGGAITLASMNIAGTRLAPIQLSALGTNVSDVVTCSASFVCAGKTLGDAVAANALSPAATLAKLFDALKANSPNDPALQMTVNEIVAAVLPFTAYPWEQLPLQGLQDVVGTGKNAHYHVSFDLKCSITSDFKVQVTLPFGFYPVPGSSAFSFGGARQAVADPALKSTDGETRGLATQATWKAPASTCSGITGTAHAELTFAAFTGLTLGTQRSQATVISVGIPHDATGDAPVLVTQNHEPNDDPTTAPQITSDELVVGHLATGGDQDFFRMPLTGIKPNSQVVAFLKVPSGADFDLTLNQPSQTGIQSTPFGATSLGVPVPDDKVGPDNSSTQPQTNTLSDIPFGATPWGATPYGATASGSISQTRGSAPESAAVVVHQASTGFLTLGVTGYNSSFSSQPYVLRVEVIPPPPLPACAPRTGYPTDATGAGVLPAPSTLPQSTQTLFLVNRQRMAKLYGAAAADSIMGAAGAANAGPSSQLATFASRSDVGGAVLSVDGNANVRAAYQAWDSNPCVTDNADGVVRSINDLLQTYRSTLPNLKYVVLLGTDTVLPQYRFTDPSVLSPELNEAQDLAFTTNGLTQGNALYAAAAQDQVLTDGAYTAFTRITWLDHDLPLPQIPVSRLVETPTDILGQIAQYTSSNGILNPTSALTTGYDFLADGADATNAALQSRFGTGLSTDTLISHPGPAPDFIPGPPAWSKNDITGTAGHFFGKTPIPDIGALFGHYNHYAFQPAGPVSSIDDVATTADASGKALAAHILFTVGCHAGLNVGDELGAATASAADLPKYLDWAQVYSKDLNAVYVANTGYGYGDTATVAASERLMTLFASKLGVNSPNIGDNWLDALTTYAGTAGVLSAVDEKVMGEATLYGLPFYHFSSVKTVPAGGTAPTSDGVVASTSYPALNISGDLAGTGVNADGTTKSTLAVPHRPIEPLITKDVSVNNQQARGLWVNALTTSDTPGVTPTQAHWIVDDSRHEPRRDFQNTYWPASPGEIIHMPTLHGARDFLNINAGSFMPGSGTTGTQRNVQSIGVDVTYSNATDVTAPLITQATAVQNPSDNTKATIFARVSDNSGALHKVAALYNDGSSGQWHYVLLAQTSPGVFQANLTGLPAGNLIEFGVEAMDNGGNTGQSWDKAFNFHEIIDSGKPSITPVNPLPGQTFVLNQKVKPNVACSDAGGISACSTSPLVGGNLDTTTIGAHSVTVSATDLSGNVTTQTIPYNVVYKFVGFDSPVDNPPVLNIVNAGRTIPLKWSVLDANGVAVNKLQTLIGISSTAIRCMSAVSDPDPSYVPLGSAGVKVDSSGYHYNWVTAKNWAGSCRRLTVALNDGTSYSADFQFN